MDELRPRSSEPTPKDKVKLAEEQKAYIREELAKCTTPQEARELRKQLAERFTVTEPQIRAVGAYKSNLDGSLTLRPQFLKTQTANESTTPELQPLMEQPIELISISSEVSPQIEAMYDNPTKRAWREKVREVIENDFTKEQLHDTRVVCLPGQALQEITEIYLPLGIQPKNIVCIERSAQVAETMRATAKALKHPVTIFEGAVEDFLKSQHEPVAIASFDFLGPLHMSFLENLQHLRTADKFMIITNFLQRRERKTEQEALSVLASVNRTLREQEDLPLDSRMKFGDDLSKYYSGKTFEESVDDVTSGQAPIGLSGARDEGMIGTLRLYLEPDLYVKPLDEIYAEVGAETPPLGTNDHHDFIYKSALDAQAVVKSAFEKYPGLSEKVAQAHRRNTREPLSNYQDFSKKGFTELIGHAMALCLIRRLTYDIRRYKYTSESAGSPYQTDILLEFDMENELKQNHRAAYGFIREFVRALGEHGKDAVTIRLEKSGEVLPRGYSGGPVAVTLALRANSTTRGRVSLHKLARLVSYFEEMMRVHIRKFPEAKELLEESRIEIKAPQ